MITQTIYTDTMKLESPEGREELALLRSLKIGDVRKSTLVSALDESLDWRCIDVQATRWRFDVTFCGVPVYEVLIEQGEQALVLTVLS